MSNPGRIVRTLAAALAFLAMASANAATIPLRASLNGAQVPLAVAGTGLGTVSFDTATKVLSWSVTYSGLSGACTAAHFHGPASAGVDAIPTVTMPTCTANPITGSSSALDPMQEAQLLSGQWYINIHTAANPGGEIRGQVLPVRGDLNADGQSDVVWRNTSTGENYLYPMNGITILGSEGYLRTVADQNWQMVGIGDFDGDGKADILWRNSSTGENYLYPMDGTTILGTEGYLRTVADQNWQVAGVGDFNGDGKADILWRNSSTGENYIYPMDGKTILGTEGYIRTVVDQSWQVAGVGDFNGDGKADILWRNGSTGENYIYAMNGTTILGTEGYIRTVADQAWQVAGVGDFDGDGRSDILWRNSTAGENYVYPMAGLTILETEGYIRTVADQSWQVAGVGDFNGDGKADILWRNSSTGENYLYPMDGKTILGTEGYLRTVADQNWQVAVSGTPPPPAETISGLEFPSNIPGPNNDSSVRFRFSGAALVPIYGTGGAGVTYIWKYRPKQQTGFYTAFFWGNDDDQGSPTTFEWDNGNPDSYYGAHPYPPGGGFSGTHEWEIAVENSDFFNGAVVKGVWYSQAFRAWGANGAAKNHEYYWNLPNLTTDIVTRTTATSWGNQTPPSPMLTWGDAPWNPSQERASGVLRGWQIYNALLTTAQINALAACDTDACVLAEVVAQGVAGSLWYLNMNPQDESDISDKSGAGHHPSWWNANRPTHWTE